MYIRDGLQKIEYDKNEDNFLAIFNNPEMREQFETVFNIMMNLESFSVGEFIRKYRTIFYENRFDNYFRGRNTKKLIDVYTNYHKIKLPYNNNRRRWTPITKEDDASFFQD